MAGVIPSSTFPAPLNCGIFMFLNPKFLQCIPSLCILLLRVLIFATEPTTEMTKALSIDMVNLAINC